MTCPFCNKELPDGSQFCGFCGKKLSAPAPIPVPVPVEEVKEQAENVAEEVKTEVSEVAETAENTASEAVEEVNEQAANAAEKVKTEVSEVAETAENTASEAVEAVKEQTANVAEEVKTEVSEVAETAENTVSEAVEAVKEQAANVAEEVKTEVSEVAETAKPEEAPSAESLNAQPAEEAKPAEAPVGNSWNFGQGAVETAADAADTANAAEPAEGAKTIDFMKLIKSKTFIICCAAVVLFIVLIAVIANVAAANMNKSPIKGGYYSVNSDGEVVYFYNGKQIKGTDFSGGAGTISVSADRTCALVGDGDSLYYLSNGKCSEITDEYGGNAILSANGKTAVYAEDDALYAFTGGKSKSITDAEGDITGVAVSPDGKTVVFSDYDDGDYNAYAWNGSKVIDLDAKMSVYTVSNGGKMIYGSAGGKFAYIKNLKADSMEKLRDFDGVTDISTDHNKILFKSGSSVYYFDSSAKEEIKVSGSSFYTIAPGNYSTTLDSFNKFYGYSGNGIYKFSRKGSEFDKDKIISGVDDYILSADGKTFFIFDDDELLKISASNPDKEKTIAEDVYSFKSDHSGKFIYFLDEDCDLRYVSSKNKKVGNDVSKYLVNDSGVCVFVNDDGDLYCSSKGGEKKKLLSDVTSLSKVNDIFYAVSDDELYVSTNGKKFTSTGVDM